MSKLESTAPNTLRSVTSSSLPGDSPQRQSQVETESKAEHNRGTSLTSQSSTPKVESGVLPKQDSEQIKDEPPNVESMILQPIQPRRDSLREILFHRASLSARLTHLPT